MAAVYFYSWCAAVVIDSKQGPTRSIKSPGGTTRSLEIYRQMGPGK